VQVDQVDVPGGGWLRRDPVGSCGASRGWALWTSARRPSAVARSAGVRRA